MSRILNTIYDLTRFEIGCQPLTNRSKSIISTGYLEIEHYRWNGIIPNYLSRKVVEVQKWPVIVKLKMIGHFSISTTGSFVSNYFKFKLIEPSSFEIRPLEIDRPLYFSFSTGPFTFKSKTRLVFWSGGTIKGCYDQFDIEKSFTLIQDRPLLES